MSNHVGFNFFILEAVPCLSPAALSIASSVSGIGILETSQNFKNQNIAASAGLASNSII